MRDGDGVTAVVGVATGGFAFGFGPGLRRCFAEEGGTGAVDGDGDIDAELMVRTVIGVVPAERRESYGSPGGSEALVIGQRGN